MPIETKIISNDIQIQLLNLYQPNFRFLKSLENTYPTTKGTFQIPEVSYTRDKYPGLSAAAGLLLFNQATIAFLANVLVNKSLPEVTDFQLLANDVEDFCNDLVIQKFDKLTYNKPILLGEELFFEITIDSCVNKLQSKNLIFFELRIDICGGKHLGKGTYCYRRNKTERIT